MAPVSGWRSAHKKLLASQEHLADWRTGAILTSDNTAVKVQTKVFNDRGATVLPAEVTDRIAPGVVSIREGVWLTPGERGDDGKGCANVLTDGRSAPCDATTYNTCLVQVEPARAQGYDTA